ncbi:hypothetical protein CB1_001159005 [Camelus ferus]|nr:hypothetical protein CB1_001159005 [Camelus ferus]
MWQLLCDRSSYVFVLYGPEAEIDNIHQLVVGATENIKEGNEDIREAIKNNAGFRVWVLFFLVMCSFSLLFLDWYDS